MASLWDKLKDLLARGARALTGDQAGGPASFFNDRSNWIPVSSSNLHSVAYYVDLRRGGGGNLLRVRFKDKGGRVSSEYEYGKVPPAVMAGLLSAPSKGVYLDRNVKKAGYSFRQIR